MVVSATRHPDVMKLERLDYLVPIAELRRMNSAFIWDDDPNISQNGYCTALAALHSEHHAQIVSQANEPLFGRPMYFVRRGTGLELFPRCDKTYWLRTTYRATVKYGAPLEPIGNG